MNSLFGNGVFNDIQVIILGVVCFFLGRLLFQNLLKPKLDKDKEILNAVRESMNRMPRLINTSGYISRQRIIEDFRLIIKITDFTNNKGSEEIFRSALYYLEQQDKK